MAIEIRTLSEELLPALFRADGRAFGSVFSDEEMVEIRPTIDVSRFRVAVERGRVLSAAGSIGFELTLPGGSAVPACGVTWVATQPTHRRQGLMSGVLEAVHADATDRDEPVSILTASESGIYGRFGYGVASHVRVSAISTHQAALRDGTPGAGRVWFAEDADEVRANVLPLWERHRRSTPGELSRSEAMWDRILALRSRERDSYSPCFWLLHRDGYACYRIESRWNMGQPAHSANVVEMVALTDDARGALWRTVFSLDLVADITTMAITLDDPLVHWLANPRAVRTTAFNDWMWVKPLDPARLLSARAYRIPERLVIDVEGRRWLVDATNGPVPDVRAVRTKPDISTDSAGLGAMILGGVRVAELARAGRLTGASDAAVARGDAMFSSARLPASQTPF